MWTFQNPHKLPDVYRPLAKIGTSIYRVKDSAILHHCRSAAFPYTIVLICEQASAIFVKVGHIVKILVAKIPNIDRRFLVSPPF